MSSKYCSETCSTFDLNFQLKCARHKTFSGFGIQTRPLEACWVNTVPKLFQLLTYVFILNVQDKGFSGCGTQTSPFAACWANIVLKLFQLLTYIFTLYVQYTRDLVAMAFKLEHLEPVKKILFWNFYNFWFSFSA